MTTAPKITPEDIEAAIAWEGTFRAGHALQALTRMGIEAEGSYLDTKGQRGADDRLSLLTIHIIVLHNGFNVVGTSAPVSMENFSAEIGAKVARQKAIDQLWPVLGYALLDRMHNAAPAQDSGIPPHPPHVLRMIAEYRELNKRWQKLTMFMDTPLTPFADLPFEERTAMREQSAHMNAYAAALLDRLNRAGVGKDELL